MDMKGRRRTRVAYGEQSPNAVLTDVDVLSIRAQYKNGVSQLQLAALYGVRQSRIWLIVHNKAWKHLLPLE
jgi:hypothetical protein